MALESGLSARILCGPCRSCGSCCSGTCGPYRSGTLRPCRSGTLPSWPSCGPYRSGTLRSMRPVKSGLSARELGPPAASRCPRRSPPGTCSTSYSTSWPTRRVSIGAAFMRAVRQRAGDLSVVVNTNVASALLASPLPLACGQVLSKDRIRPRPLNPRNLPSLSSPPSRTPLLWPLSQFPADSSLSPASPGIAPRAGAF